MLKVDVKNLEAVTILCVQGDIVTGEPEILCDAVQSLADTRTVILDLSRVSKVDAHGLGVLLELREQTDAKGIHFALMNVSQRVSNLLELTHLDSVFQISSGVEFFPSALREPEVVSGWLRSCA